MRSGIERILTERGPPATPGPVEISGYSHFFGFEPSGQPGLLSEYLKNLQIVTWAWHLPKMRLTGPLFKPLVLEFFGAANKKGDFSQEGAASLSSSRKESRK
jgi:hypothetical protein